MKKYILFIFILIIILSIYSIFSKKQILTKKARPLPTPSIILNPLSIQAMRQRSYPGSDIIIEQTLEPGSNYSRYITSYKSDGLKIYALLTVPNGPVPRIPTKSGEVGWPVIVFNHGYIPPEIYRTTERYVAYTDAFSRNGYIVFKPDYRGNGLSEGKPEGAYYSPAYAIDDLNAIASIKKYSGADKNKIGLWGHSMGGNIALRVLAVNRTDIKAAVIWGGVVGSYDDLMNNWQRKVTYQPPPRELALRNNYRQDLVLQYGTPKSNPGFWNQIDPTYFVKDINAPLQLHHGLADEEVPVAFSQSLYDKLKSAGKTTEFYTYPGADHNISDPSFSVAMNRSVDFFDKYLK
jgi:dipeptidyl aminopeptidase/acylaminoacyl peptidase